jgi:hypothetical protein
VLLPLLEPVLLPVLEPLVPMSDDEPVVELSLDFLCFLWCFLPVVEDWLLAPWSLALLLEV